MSKITVIGAGSVGATIANDLMVQGIASEIVLIDINKEKAFGEALDIYQAAPFCSPAIVRCGDYPDATDSDIVVITSGVARKPGQSRLDLAQTNVNILKDITPNIVKVAPKAVYIIVSNPVDILTYIALKESGYPANRVIGSGTVLDTGRFRYELGEHLGVDSRSVHAYIIGEHGDSELAAWSDARVGGLKISDFCELRGHFNHEDSMTRIFDHVKNSAYEIISKKHATYYGIAMAVVRICSAIVRDEKSIMPVSSLMTGEYGLYDVVLSIPAVVDANGIETVVPIELSETELLALKKSADILKDILKDNV